MKRKQINAITRRCPDATCVSPKYVKRVKRLGAKRFRAFLREDTEREIEMSPGGKFIYVVQERFGQPIGYEIADPKILGSFDSAVPIGRLIGSELIPWESAECS